MTTYRIYGREKGKGKFKAFDYSNGVFVANLIYASFFYESEYDKLVEVVEYMNTNNYEYEFQIRKV